MAADPSLLPFLEVDNKPDSLITIGKRLQIRIGRQPIGCVESFEDEDAVMPRVFSRAREAWSALQFTFHSILAIANLQRVCVA